MEMRTLRDNVNMEQLIGQRQTQAVVDGEITLPGGLREEARVLQAGGMVVLQSGDCLQDRVNLEGKVVFHALYTQGDPNQIQSIEASADFSHAVELAGCAPKMLCRAQASVEHVEATANNGRLSLKAILLLSVRVLSTSPVSLVSGVQDVSGLEVQTQTLSMQRTVSMGDGEALLREEFELAQVLDITETFYGTAQANVIDVSGGQGRANVSGTVQIEVYHASKMPSRPLAVTRHTLAFEQAVDLMGENGEMLSADVLVKDVAVLSQDAGDGSRVLRAEVLLGVRAWGDVSENATVLMDAYTTQGDNIDMTTENISYRVGDSHMQTAESGKLMLMLPEGSPAARTMLGGFATPIITGREQIGGRLTIEGMLEVTLIYMTDDSETPVTIFQEEPFRILFACEAEANDFLMLEAGDIEVSSITSDRVEMKYIMRLTTDGIRIDKAQVVTDVELTQTKEAMSGVALYFVQPGEGLWDIAKHYRVPTQQLTELNPDLQEKGVEAGQGVVVWRRMATE